MTPQTIQKLRDESGSTNVLGNMGITTKSESFNREAPSMQQTTT
jgi:hypothetical protein